MPDNSGINENVERLGREHHQGGEGEPGNPPHPGLLDGVAPGTVLRVATRPSTIGQPAVIAWAAAIGQPGVIAPLGVTGRLARIARLAVIAWAAVIG